MDLLSTRSSKSVINACKDEGSPLKGFNSMLGKFIESMRRCKSEILAVLASSTLFSTEKASGLAFNSLNLLTSFAQSMNF